jgi:type I restriction enzyme R subunit
LIEAFIDENLLTLKPADDLDSAFAAYWDTRKQQAFTALCAEENVAADALEQILKTYVFANRLPRDEEVVKALTFKPKILERKDVIARVKDKISAFIETFVEGMGGSV